MYKEIYIIIDVVCYFVIIYSMKWHTVSCNKYRGAGKSLAQPGRKQATVTEDFDVHISYL